jgi:3-methyladenine DNA glycosylase AlkD
MSGRSGGPAGRTPRGPGRAGSRDVVKEPGGAGKRSPGKASGAGKALGAGKPFGAGAAFGKGAGRGAAQGASFGGAASAKSGAPMGAASRTKSFGKTGGKPTRPAPRDGDDFTPQDFTNESDGFVAGDARRTAAVARKPRAKYVVPAGRRRSDVEKEARAAQAAKAPKSAAPRAISLRAPADPAVAAMIDQLRAAAEPGKAEAMAAQHHTGRVCFGVPGAAVDAIARGWRAALAEEADAAAARLSRAAGLWETGGFEARIAAAKLLTQAKIDDDAPVWALIASWIPQIDSPAIGDAVAAAAARRVLVDPTRLAQVARWVKSAHLPTRLAALEATLPIAKGRLAGEPGDRAIERIASWAATLGGDGERAVQKAAGVWLATLSRHDEARVRAVIDANGETMKPYAVREALRLIDKPAAE